jgi:hypothetical protein
VNSEAGCSSGPTAGSGRRVSLIRLTLGGCTAVTSPRLIKSRSRAAGSPYSFSASFTEMSFAPGRMVVGLMAGPPERPSGVRVRTLLSLQFLWPPEARSTGNGDHDFLLDPGSGRYSTGALAGMFDRCG